MESNLATIPDNAASLLETWNPFDNDQNYMVVSVDTTYPYSDNYAEEAGEYKSARSTFIMGMGGVIVGIAGFFATLEHWSFYPAMKMEQMARSVFSPSTGSIQKPVSFCGRW